MARQTCFFSDAYRTRLIALHHQHRGKTLDDLCLDPVFHIAFSEELKHMLRAPMEELLSQVRGVQDTQRSPPLVTKHIGHLGVA